MLWVYLLLQMPLVEIISTSSKKNWVAAKYYASKCGIGFSVRSKACWRVPLEVVCSSRTTRVSLRCRVVCTASGLKGRVKLIQSIFVIAFYVCYGETKERICNSLLVGFWFLECSYEVWFGKVYKWWLYMHKLGNWILIVWANWMQKTRNHLMH